MSAEQRVVVAVPGNAPPRRRGESLICQRIPEERPTKCQSRSVQPRLFAKRCCYASIMQEYGPVSPLPVSPSAAQEWWIPSAKKILVPNSLAVRASPGCRRPCYEYLWQLRCTDTLLRALLLPSPHQLPPRRQPLAKKFKFPNFLDHGGTTPGAAASDCPGSKLLLALSSQ